MAQAQAAAQWCRRCGQPVRLAGGDRVEDEFRKAVHADTGQEGGRPDGHLAAPISYEPPLWRAARVLGAEFPEFHLDAWLGILRADWANLPVAAVAAHFTVPGTDAEAAEAEQQMRRKLKAALAAVQPEGTDMPELAAVPGGDGSAEAGQ